MNGAQCITTVNDAILEKMIADARRRIIYMAPGISAPVAGALVEAAARLAPQAVDVILDMDSDVYRLGYGTVEGLRVLEEAALPVCQQEGVRIGLLIADDATLVYAPTPQLVEAEPDQPDRPNGIRLGAPPPALALDVGLGPQPDRERAVGLDVVSPQQVSAGKTELERNPPAAFDLARKVRVYSSHFQFVEFELKGCQISVKKAPIPSTLMGMENRKELESRFHAQYTVAGNIPLRVDLGNGNVLDERVLTSRKNQIANDFLIRLTGYGSLIRKSMRAEFDQAVEDLRADVERFSNGVMGALQEAIDKNAAELTDALLPTVLRNPPRAYQKLYGLFLDEAQVRRMLLADILRAFGTADDLIDRMQVRTVFKDVAYESLKSEEFLAAVHKAIPGLGALHKESDAIEVENAPS